jgi:predicted transglutaminase-like cysteine proteinase
MRRLNHILMLLGIAALPVLSAGLPAGAQSRASLEPASSAAPRLVKAPPGFTQSCARYTWLCSQRPAAGGGLAAATALGIARQVNHQVNSAIMPLTDPENYGVAEYWTLPGNGRGDCEDYVLEKYRLLLDAGVDSRDLRIAVVLDRNRDNHVVLILRHETGDLVLDNLTPGILPWNQTGYTYLAMQMGEDKSLWEIVAGRSRHANMLVER